MSRFRTFVKRYFPALVYARNYLKAGKLRRANYSDIFDEVYRQNYWGNQESRSGPGSNLNRTAAIRAQLPALCREYGIKTFLDIPCGDFQWMQHVDLGVQQYIGADIVEDMVRQNNERYGSERRQFLRLDVAADALPRVDLVFCRDCLVHFDQRLIAKTIENIHRSGSTYLLTTTFIYPQSNVDIVTGQWRPLNLQRRPFNFPEPLALIDEQAPAQTGGAEGKRLGLWRVDTL